MHCFKPSQLIATEPEASTVRSPKGLLLWGPSEVQTWNPKAGYKIITYQCGGEAWEGPRGNGGWEGYVLMEAVGWLKKRLKKEEKTLLELKLFPEWATSGQGTLVWGTMEEQKANMKGEGKGRREVLLRTELREVAEVNFTSFLSWMALSPWLKAPGLSLWELSGASSHSIRLLGLAVGRGEESTNVTCRDIFPSLFLVPK